MADVDPNDPALSSWVPVPPGSDFPIQNLPWGVFRRRGAPATVGVAIGDHVVDVAVLAREGLLDGVAGVAARAFEQDSLNPFLALGRRAWTATRRRLATLLSAGDRRLRDEPALAARAVVPVAQVTLGLPFEVGDFVDFYSSLHHATNLGRMFRPGDPPLLPNWRHLPVAYHGRSASIVASGTEVVRPNGQRLLPGGEVAAGPSEELDFELEVGFVTGPGPAGGRIPVARAGDHIFGFVLVNDWSARDLQRWEYQPLGPFLGKSFATSVSPWVVTLDALEPFTVPGPEQDPAPPAYLRGGGPGHLDLHLEVALAGAGMAEPVVVSRTSFRDMYWSPAQQLAHATVNGAAVRAGDLFASGTVSGPAPGTEGSLIELSWRGERPLALPDGSARAFLADGDTVVLRGWCGGDGRPRVGFGEVSGTVAPAPPL